METFNNVVLSIKDFLWGPIMLCLLIGTHVLLTIRTKGIQRKTFTGVKLSVTPDKEASGDIGGFAALATALAATIGTGNIVGVATAIGIGGPGAVFWMWLWAFFAMTVKMCEATLGSYYRKKNANGEYVGGSYYYMEEGIAKEKGWKIGYVLAWLFALCFFSMFLSGSQASVLAESLHAGYNVPMIPFVIVYTLFMFYIVWKGVPRIAKTLSKAVPVMCVLYLLAGIIIIVMNIGNLPSVIISIFSINPFKNSVQNREDLNVAVVVDRRFSISFQMERIDHVHVIQVCGSRLIS